MKTLSSMVHIDCTLWLRMPYLSFACKTGCYSRNFTFLSLSSTLARTDCAQACGRSVAIHSDLVCRLQDRIQFERSYVNDSVFHISTQRLRPVASNTDLVHGLQDRKRLECNKDFIFHIGAQRLRPVALTPFLSVACQTEAAWVSHVHFSQRCCPGVLTVL